MEPEADGEELVEAGVSCIDPVRDCDEVREAVGDGCRTLVVD